MPATLAHTLLATVQAEANMFRTYQGFADAMETKPDAPAFERALALSGRDPAWKPPR